MKKLLIVLALIAAAIAAAGILLPKEMRIEREVVIDRPAADVFGRIKSIRYNQSWNPWLKLDPNTVTTYKGADGTVGSSAAWAGNDKVGEGEQEITEIVPGQKIVSELRFKKPMTGTAVTWLATESVGPSQTKVKWGFVSESKFPQNIFCALMGKAYMTKTFDSGLADLKALLEKK